MAKEQINIAAVQAAVADTDGADWEAGENHLTALTAKQRRIRLGVPVPDDSHRAALERRAAGVRAAGPQTLDAGPAADAGAAASFDLRNVSGQSYVSGIRDQGSCGSCVSFGSVAVMEGTARYARRMPALAVDLSEAHLFYGHGGTVGVTCLTGWLPLPALTFCTTKGITYETEFPYTPGNSGGGSAPSGWESHRARATGTADLTNKIAAIKQHLVDVGPVTGCFIVYTDFYSYSAGVYKHVTGAEEGGHCVAIVGYDDAKRAWIIKNSWGTGWGMGGFGYIGYGECLIDTWSNIGVTGVRLRTWTAAKKVLGGYGSGYDRSGWVYVQDNGWLHVGGTTSTAHVAMFADLLTAKGKGAFVNAYEDEGLITQAYAY
ncbi:C1 family peptidase [Luteipulveratus mongoliensis]|uniref:Peptidase C1A papain C-terminal domain-containing protein n=1 Tax=Luteipulveratus mongoliensis TaxID=571913 RepID=A0A0K1JDQ6_9MICO|nr:C1 family peptidase [Luteipulveratus mongoliensis]AKU14839.1 hypothetical protein VV02_01420 [Luteipulveratus mongoliensis]